MSPAVAKDEDKEPLLRESSRLKKGKLEEEVSNDGTTTLRIKTTGDGKEYSVSIRPQNTVSELKKNVCTAIGAEGKFVRLIASGKLLTPDTAILGDFNLADQSFIHCVVSSVAPRAPQQQPSAPPPVEEDESDDPATRRGFDVLRNRGMTRSEVVAIRGYFSAQVRAFGEQTPAPPSVVDEAAEPPSEWDRQMELEERWMAAQRSTSEFVLNTRRTNLGVQVPQLLQGTTPLEVDGSTTGPGTTQDFVFGFVLGILLGIIVLFWLWESSVPQRQKLGILAGVMVQLVANMVRHVTTDGSE